MTRDRFFIFIFSGIAIIAILFLYAAFGYYLENFFSGPDKSPYSNLKPCQLPGVAGELLCGKLSVFENREMKSGRKININVVVMPALEANPGPDPIFILAGEPGMPNTNLAHGYASYLNLDEYRRKRDIVLVDERGTGASNPLHCNQGKSDDNLQSYLNEGYTPEMVMACRQELEKKADLTQYTTPISMKDLDEVRQWLGYERINLIGASYGTRAALVYMQQYPENVRSAILINTMPTYFEVPLYRAYNSQRAFDLLIKECQEDSICGRRFPNLEKDFKSVMNKLRREPATAMFANPKDAKEVKVNIGPEIFSEILRYSISSSAGSRRLPYIIHNAAKGDFTPFLQLALQQNIPDALAEGKYLSVTCSEDVKFIQPEEVDSLNKDTYSGDFYVSQQIKACEEWPQGILPSDYYKPLISEAPALIISGYMDPVSPPSWGAEVASNLPNSKHHVIRHMAHHPAGLSNFNCLDSLMGKFIQQPETSDFDTGCLDNMLPPPFYIENTTTVN